MKRSIYFFLLLNTFTFFLMGAEPSAFGAGNLNSPQPYGLTSNEKIILDTKDKLHRVSVKSNNQENKLDSLRERIDGLQSVIENLSRKAHNNKINLQKQNEQSILNSQNTGEYSKRLSDIVSNNSQSAEQLKIIITEMSLLMDVINSKYVSKDELNALVVDVNNFKSLVSRELKNITKKSSRTKKKSKSSADVYTEAKSLFKKKKYKKAIKNYEYLIKNKYKPAFSHYMIGEINFKIKNYSNAISYFKKSSSLYDKGSYMPTLILHTAIAMSKTGDKKHAKAFFQAVAAKYPNSAEAKKANEYLQP